MKNKLHNLRFKRARTDKSFSLRVQPSKGWTLLEKGFAPLHIIRFHTTLRLHQKATRFKPYKKWADYRYSHNIHAFIGEKW